ncbi:MAG TPA: glutamine-hydrolyzing GMP synthase, partial [Streptosporangiaceae bacterium]|nr:glutamine-hydrolyzing GMP synthase [Streptosporangiaceae bacterium]
MHPSGSFDIVLVVDYGAQYAQLIARRVRECHVYSEIVPHTMPVAEMLARQPKAIILSGGPASVYADGAPPGPDGLFTSGVPVLGICYGFQLMVQGLGGTVRRTGAAEYGATTLDTTAAPGRLLDGLPARQRVWMSHGDTCVAAPPGFEVTASTGATPVAAIEDAGRQLFGVQFHPEVMHTDHGQAVLQRFLDAAGCQPGWTTAGIIDEQVEQIR